MTRSGFHKTKAFNRGLVLRRKVLGSAHVKRSLARAEEDPFLLPVQQIATEFAWGEVWSRPGLDRKTRSFLSIALLAAFGEYEEFRTHIRGAVNNGASRNEIGEVLLHVGVYCGMPAAIGSTRVAKEVLDEIGA